MQALYDGCKYVIRTVAREELLAPTWTIEEAADFFWATLSIVTWENLTIERGWSQEQYCARMQWVIKRALLQV